MGYLQSLQPKLALPALTNALRTHSHMHARAQTLPDLILDTPSAPSLLEKFTQQAMTDGCLPADYKPPSFPTNGTGGVAVSAENGNHETST